MALVTNLVVIIVSLSLSLRKLRGPESKVVSDELHDGGSIFVDILLKLLNVSDGLVEGLLGELASLGGVVHDFIVEDREVKGKSESDGVSGLKVSVGNLRSVGVCLEGIVSGLLMEVSDCVLGNISVVVSLHLEVEDVGLGVTLTLWDKLVVEDLENILAVGVELVLDSLLVLLEEVKVLGALGLLLSLDG